jgi:outer membrane protein assembly factor BamA
MIVLLGCASTAHGQDSSPTSGNETETGYPQTHAGSAVEIESTENLNEAPRYVIEAIRIDGATRTAAGLIRREVGLSVGDLLVADDPTTDTIRWRLMATGWFRDVRLSLERGSVRGSVILVVRVRERNTLIVRNVFAGVSQSVSGSDDSSASAIPYGGIALEEGNLLGRGLTLGAEALISGPQQAGRIYSSYPSVRGLDLGLRSEVLLSNAREFFGRSPQVSISCPPEYFEDEEECPEEIGARNAVVFYRRLGLQFGGTTSLGTSGRFALDWRGDFVRVRLRPGAASETRISPSGESDTRPIDFAIAPDSSLASLLSLSYEFESRDNPLIPRRGSAFRLTSDFASRLLGSDYEFVRLQASMNRWFPIGQHQYLRLGAFLGVVFGEAPFFYRFHIGDLSDLIPSRIMGMSLDHRATPNLLGTSIEWMRLEERAMRVDLEYGYTVPLGRRRLSNLRFYGLVGLVGLGDERDVYLGVDGYSGLSRLPIDLTLDVGLRFDTPVGLFQIAFSNLLGFLPK